MKSWTDDIVQKIIAQKTTQYFINGAPGSGKSYALQRLKHDVPEYIAGTIIFGPFHISLASYQPYCQWVIQSFYDASYLDDKNPHIHDIAELWEWLSEEVDAPNKTVILLLDIEGNTTHSPQQMADFFSALRSLDTTNHKRQFKLHHVLTGYWDHVALENHYQTTHISFPYTVGHNYRLWDGLTAEDIKNLIPQESLNRDLYADVLYEITGGHAQMIIEILANIGYEFKLEHLLHSIHTLAQSSITTTQLVAVWKELPQSVIVLLTDLLIHRSLPINANSSLYHYLLSNGIASFKQIDQQNYLHFKGWYIELMIRYHQGELRIIDERVGKLTPSDILPQIQSLNFEAYRLVYDIENAARNLVVIMLSIHKNLNETLLNGFTRNNPKSDDDELSIVADNQRTLADRRGLNIAINPIIAYISTNDLANLIEDIGYKYNLNQWKIVGKTMKDVKDIRNAVMHNQLIDEISLNKLYELQSQIYSAFTNNLS